MDQDSLLQSMVAILVKEAHPEKIVLFGSRARGEAKLDSDVDLLIVEKEPFSPQRSRRKEAFRLAIALAKFPISKDLLLYSQDEFDYWKNSLNHVVGHACREGKVLYG